MARKEVSGREPAKLKRGLEKHLATKDRGSMLLQGEKRGPDRRGKKICKESRRRFGR
jgi:hypothetical protein